MAEGNLGQILVQCFFLLSILLLPANSEVEPDGPHLKITGYNPGGNQCFGNHGEFILADIIKICAIVYYGEENRQYMTHNFHYDYDLLECIKINHNSLKPEKLVEKWNENNKIELFYKEMLVDKLSENKLSTPEDWSLSEVKLLQYSTGHLKFEIRYAINLERYNDFVEVFTLRDIVEVNRRYYALRNEDFLTVSRLSKCIKKSDKIVCPRDAVDGPYKIVKEDSLKECYTLYKLKQKCSCKKVNWDSTILYSLSKSEFLLWSKEVVKITNKYNRSENYTVQNCTRISVLKTGTFEFDDKELVVDNITDVNKKHFIPSLSDILFKDDLNSSSETVDTSVLFLSYIFWVLLFIVFS